jgi:hypothetical protein
MDVNREKRTQRPELGKELGNTRWLFHRPSDQRGRGTVCR